jgi:hypothetical protein
MTATLIQSFDIAKSTRTNISTLLRLADPLALFQIIRQCFAPQFVYLANVCPSIFAETAGRIDVHLVKLLEALGHISGSDYDDLVKERIHHRMRKVELGCSRCGSATRLNTAFLQAAPTIVDTAELVDGDDVHTAGAFHAEMKDVYGPGSFDGGKVDLRR